MRQCVRDRFPMISVSHIGTFSPDSLHPIDLLKITENAYPVHARINTASVAKIKQRAAECHASQLDGGPRRRGLAGLLFRLADRRETFMRAHPPGLEGVIEYDLFSGVELEIAE